MKTILFIDQGNILRSVVAEKYLKKILKTKRIIIVSRGIQGALGYLGPQYDSILKYKNFLPPLMRIFKKYKLSLNSHHAKVVSNNDLIVASLIIALDHKTYKTIRKALKKINLPLVKLRLFEELNGNKDDLSDPWTMNSPSTSGTIAEHIIITLKNNHKKIIEWC